MPSTIFPEVSQLVLHTEGVLCTPDHFTCWVTEQSKKVIYWRCRLSAQGTRFYLGLHEGYFLKNLCRVFPEPFNNEEKIGKQSPDKISQRNTTFWVSSIAFAEDSFSCITKTFWDHILLSKAPRFAIYSRISALKCTALIISWHSCTNLSWHSCIWVVTVVIWALLKTLFLKNRAAAVLEMWKRYVEE